LHYASNFVYTQAGTGTKRAIFTPPLVAGGQYEVFIWFPKCWVCGTNVPYQINYAGGSTTILVNQNDRNLAGKWNSLGIFTFEAGSSGTIIITNNASARVMADAVRFVPR
jgi:hyaluronate lyase